MKIWMGDRALEPQQRSRAPLALEVIKDALRDCHPLHQMTVHDIAEHVLRELNEHEFKL